MQNVATRDSLVLVLSRKMLEAADIADFAKSRSLGEVIVESNVDRARDLLSENRFSIAFIGLPASDDRCTLVNDLNARRTHVVLLDDDLATHRGGEIRVVSRPFTDVDLECAVSGPCTRTNRRVFPDNRAATLGKNIGNPDAA